MQYPLRYPLRYPMRYFLKYPLRYLLRYLLRCPLRCPLWYPLRRTLWYLLRLPVLAERATGEVGGRYRRGDWAGEVVWGARGQHARHAVVVAARRPALRSREHSDAMYCIAVQCDAM